MPLKIATQMLNSLNVTKNGINNTIKTIKNHKTKNTYFKKSKQPKKSKKSKKSKQPKKSNPKGYDYCIVCKKYMEMHNSEEATTKNGRKRMIGKCEYDHKMSKFI